MLRTMTITQPISSLPVVFSKKLNRKLASQMTTNEAQLKYIALIKLARVTSWFITQKGYRTEYKSLHEILGLSQKAHPRKWQPTTMTKPITPPTAVIRILHILMAIPE
jgi:hypothetical protein